VIPVARRSCWASRKKRQGDKEGCTIQLSDGSGFTQIRS
jgi:hypothetical protein